MDKKGAYECVQKVQHFFYIGKSFGGKLFSKPSSNKVVSIKKVKKSALEEEIEKFTDSRCEEAAATISCDEVFVKELLATISETYLIVDHVDLNSKSFSTELGALFLSESSFCLFVETTNLSKLGSDRMQELVKATKSLFDNRLRVILYGKVGYEGLSERRFSISDLKRREGSSMLELEETNAKIEKLNKDLKEKDASLYEKDCIISNLKESLSAKSNRDGELVDALQTIHEKEMELKSLAKMKDDALEKLEKSAFDKDQVSRRLEEALRGKSLVEKTLQESVNSENIRLATLKENKDLKERLDKLEQQNRLLEKQINSAVKDRMEVGSQTNGNDDAIDCAKTASKSSQTKKVDIGTSSLSNIVINIDNHGGTAVDKVFKFIRHFTCETKNLKMPDGQFHCSVKVTKGKHITDIKELTEFEAYGETMGKAKEAAYLVFIDKLRTKADEV